MRSFLGLLAVLLLALLLIGCSGSSSPEPAYIGHVTPRTGRDKDIGRQEEVGILLALKRATEAGNDIGGKRLVVLHGDTTSDPEALQPQAVRLLTINRAQALMGGTNAAQAGRLAGVVSSYNVPLVTSSGFATPQATPGVICLGMAPGEQGKALARYLGGELKKKRVAVLTDNRLIVATVLTTALVQDLRKQEGTTIEEFSYAKEDELPELARRVAGRMVEAVVVSGTAGDLLQLRAEARKAGLAEEVPWLLGAEEGSLKELQAAGSAADGVFTMTAFRFDEDPPRLKEFAKQFQAEAGRPPEPAVALAYESCLLLFETFREIKVVQGSKARQELAQKKSFEGLTGTVHFDAERRARRPLFVVRVEKDDVKRQWRYEPPAEP